MTAGLLLPAQAWAAAPAACVPVGDQGLFADALRGSFSAPGETDCLEVTSEPGALINVILPVRVTGAAAPRWTLTDGDGTNLCETNECRLTGPGPYRILLTAAGQAVGDYRLAVQRMDRIEGCASVPLSEFGAETPVTAALSADRFATCYQVPADRPAEMEAWSVAQIGDSGTFHTLARDAETGGQGPCGSNRAVPSYVVFCRFPATRAYTFVVTGGANDAQYRVTRRNADATTAACATPASTTLGGPGVAGELEAVDDIHCYRVTGSPADSYWLGATRAANTARTLTFDAEGGYRCAVPRMTVCRAAGSTGYTTFVWPEKDGADVPYRFDAWNLGTNTTPPAQCQVVSGAPGFGPLTGTLTEQRTAVCVAVPVSGPSTFSATITNTAGGTALPEPYYLRTTGTGGYVQSCSYDAASRGCFTYDPGDGLALFLATMPTLTGTYPFRVETGCYPVACDTP
jgi:hypothetical protein